MKNCEQSSLPTGTQVDAAGNVEFVPEANFKRTTLAQIQTDVALVARLGLTTLAWLMHEVELTDPPDDLTLLAIVNEIEWRGNLAAQIWRDEYMRLWPEHARERGYRHD